MHVRTYVHTCMYVYTHDLEYIHIYLFLARVSDCKEYFNYVDERLLSLVIRVIFLLA